MNKAEAAWAAKTADIAGFASPWVTKQFVKAHGYPTALNVPDAIKGFKGKRTRTLFHMVNASAAIGKMKCVRCGHALGKPAEGKGEKIDTHSTWTFFPGKGVGNGMHYVCSWSALFDDIMILAEKMGY